MDIHVGEIKTLSLKNVAFSGFLGNIVVNAPAGTTPDKTHLDLTKMICRAKITRDSKTTSLFNMNLKELIVLTHYFDTRYNQIFDPAESFGIKANGRSLFPVRFGLGTTNLKNSDVLDLEIELQSGFFKAGVTEASSYVRIDPYKTVGIEYTTPEIVSYTMEANAEQFKLNLGNGISRILVFVKDSTTIPGDGNQILSSVLLKSDKLNTIEKFIDHYNRRIDAFNDVTDADLRGENCMVYAGQNLNDCSIEFEFTPGKVTASTVKVMVVKENTTAKQLRRADATAQVHAYENAVSAGVSLTPSQQVDYAKAEQVKSANLQA